MHITMTILVRGRSNLIRMKEHLRELKAALALAHRVTLIRPEATFHASVIGLHIMGAFIEILGFNLDEGLNPLIGSKGAGKTAVLSACVLY